MGPVGRGGLVHHGIIAEENALSEQSTTIDFTGVLSGKLPLFIGIVVALSALLLLVVFRSLVIPLHARS
jgi:hypothetical protein